MRHQVADGQAPFGGERHRDIVDQARRDKNKPDFQSLGHELQRSIGVVIVFVQFLGSLNCVVTQWVRRASPSRAPRARPDDMAFPVEDQQGGHGGKPEEPQDLRHNRPPPASAAAAISGSGSKRASIG